MKHSHEFKTIDSRSVKITLKNTLRNDIANNVLTARFAPRDCADYVQRSNFILFMSHVDTVDGIEWEPVDDSATEEQFLACYYGFAELVETETAYDCAMAVVRLSKRNDPLEKHDGDLTEAESTDPNS